MCAEGGNCGWNPRVSSNEAGNAFYQVNGIGDGGAGSNGANNGFGFAASRSNALYGRSTTVQPNAISLIAQVKF